MTLLRWVFFSPILQLSSVLAAQPSAVKPIPAPLRDLKFGEINFLHTTDTHGWHGGHLLEASYSADWGDYIDFAGRLREKIEADKNDLLVIDTGDRIEGNGLFDGSEPKGLYTYDIFKNQHIDIICSGNHELYKQNSSENEYFVTVPAYKDAYLASNLDIHDPHTGKLVPLAPRYKQFKTKNREINIMAFGFIFDFTGNFPNTVVQPVARTVQEAWFQEAIRKADVDLFVVIGHAALRQGEFDLIFRRIRAVRPNTPIQFFGGHWHIRDYKVYDDKAHGIASGRFMETIGFQSISGVKTQNIQALDESFSSSPTFFRRYIDNNLYSFYHHSGHNSSTFHSELGKNVTKQIDKARKALKLDKAFGCAPQDYWMSRVPYPNNSSIFSWLQTEVFPNSGYDASRGNKPRVVIANTGAIRFDIFKGPFTKDTTFIISPFTSGFHYIRDVPYVTARMITPLLNGEDQILQNSPDQPIATKKISNSEMWRLAPPEQYKDSMEFYSQHHPNSERPVQDHPNAENQFPILPDHETGPPNHLHSDESTNPTIFPGYTTKDDLGLEGDDTIHSRINFYQAPNVFESPIFPASSDFNEDNPPETIDVVFNEFIQSFVLEAINLWGSDAKNYTDADVRTYMYGRTMTDVISDWIGENWGKDC